MRIVTVLLVVLIETKLYKKNNENIKLPNLIDEKHKRWQKGLLQYNQILFFMQKQRRYSCPKRGNTMNKWKGPKRYILKNQMNIFKRQKKMLVSQ